MAAIIVIAGYYNAPIFTKRILIVLCVLFSRSVHTLFGFFTSASRFQSADFRNAEVVKGAEN